jgi:hypothetical protein
MSGAMREISMPYPTIYWGLWTPNRWIAELPDGSLCTFLMAPGGWRTRGAYHGSVEDLCMVLPEIARLACKVAGVPPVSMLDDDRLEQPHGRAASLSVG